MNDQFIDVPEAASSGAFAKDAQRARNILIAARRDLVSRLQNGTKHTVLDRLLQYQSVIECLDKVISHEEALEIGHGQDTNEADYTFLEAPYDPD